MAQERKSYIELAKGPYEVTALNGPEMAKKIHFRHFRPMEIYLAREFIRRAIIPGTYYFDVYLLTEDSKEWIRKHGEAFMKLAIPYAHRIDAVCFTKEKIHIIEFEIRLKYAAIGQLCGYKDWFARQYFPDRPLETVVVFGFDRPELHETCNRLGIRMIRLKEVR